MHVTVKGRNGSKSVHLMQNSVIIDLGTQRFIIKAAQGCTEGLQVCAEELLSVYPRASNMVILTNTAIP